MRSFMVTNRIKGNVVNINIIKQQKHCPHQDVDQLQKHVEQKSEH